MQHKEEQDGMQRRAAKGCGQCEPVSEMFNPRSTERGQDTVGQSLSEGIMTADFSAKMKDIKPQIQKALQFLSRINKRKSIWRHTIVKYKTPKRKVF